MLGASLGHRSENNHAGRRDRRVVRLIGMRRPTGDGPGIRRAALSRGVSTGER